MKRIIISILVLFLGFSTFAQENVKLRVGQSEVDIKKEFTNIQIKYDKEGNKYLYHEFENVRISYYLNNKGICINQVYYYHISLTYELLKVINSDKEYIKLSPTEYLRIGVDDNILNYTIYPSPEDKLVLLIVEQK